MSAQETMKNHSKRVSFQCLGERIQYGVLRVGCGVLESFEELCSQHVACSGQQSHDSQVSEAGKPAKAGKEALLGIRRSAALRTIRSRSEGSTAWS